MMPKRDPEIGEAVIENDREARQEQMARIEARGLKIKVSHVYPPVPVRQFDWCAYIDGHEETITTAQRLKVFEGGDFGPGPMASCFLCGEELDGSEAHLVECFEALNKLLCAACWEHACTDE